MNVIQFREHVLGLSNALVLAAEKSTTETWPANRDKILEEYGCPDLNFITLP